MVFGQRMETISPSCLEFGKLQICKGSVLQEYNELKLN